MKVTIVTPSFNQARFIGRTLASVASQHGDVEHLVFDGGSSDGTVEILRAARPQPRWVSRPDGGQAAAVNEGFAAASGEVLGWLNSDDEYVPGAVEEAARYLEEHPEVDVVYGDADHVDGENRVLAPYPTRPWDPARLPRECFICQPAVFLRRRVVDRHGSLDPTLRYSMDYEYWLRLAAAGVKFAHLPKRLARSRLHSETKTLGSRVAVHEEINDMLVRRVGGVPREWLAAYAYAFADAAGGPGWTRRIRAIRPYLAARRRWKSYRES